MQVQVDELEIIGKCMANLISKEDGRGAAKATVAMCCTFMQFCIDEKDHEDYLVAFSRDVLDAIEAVGKLKPH